MNALIIFSLITKEETREIKVLDTVGLEEGRPPLNQTKYTDMYDLFTENTWNCEITHEVEPRNDDIILSDRCDFNAFSGTKLLSYLVDNNVKHLFVT